MSSTFHLPPNTTIKKASVQYKLSDKCPACYNSTRASLYNIFKKLGYVSDATTLLEAREFIITLSIFCDDFADFEYKVANLRIIIDESYISSQSKIENFNSKKSAIIG